MFTSIILAAVLLGQTPQSRIDQVYGEMSRNVMPRTAATISPIPRLQPVQPLPSYYYSLFSNLYSYYPYSYYPYYSYPYSYYQPYYRSSHNHSGYHGSQGYYNNRNPGHNVNPGHGSRRK
jgi:hypothetical protein